MTAIQGTTASGFEPVLRAFEQSFEGAPEMGAALAIRHRGRVVADLWGGLADPRTGQPWREPTLSVIFSCTKGVVSILAARLVQDGLLDYDAPVSRYWPEFAAAGKATAKISDLLSHRAGLSAPREPLSELEVADWPLVVARLAAQEPLWDPGSGYAYHALTHGWLIGEVIRRITGLSVGEYLQEVIAQPLHAEAWIGLPAQLDGRVAHLTAGATLTQLVADQAAARDPEQIDWTELAMTLGGVFPEELVGEGAGFNRSSIRRAEIPGAGGVATARALASIWSATFAETDGVRLLNDATIARATAVQTEGPPVFDVPGPWPRWGMGFQLDSEPRRYVTPSGYGHDGAGGQVAFADPEVGIGFAFLTNQLEAGPDERATRIVDALRSVVA
jgi:CubicO group peptidase (beta-lactamase class C family)